MDCVSEMVSIAHVRQLTVSPQNYQHDYSLNWANRGPIAANLSLTNFEVKNFSYVIYSA